MREWNGLWWIFTCVWILLGCGQKAPLAVPAKAAPSAAAEEKKPTKPGADLIFYGDVVTVEDEMPLAQALVVEEEVIVYVGDRAGAEKFEGYETRVVELGEGALLPGFIDAHGHLTNVSMMVGAANLQPPPAGKIEKIADLDKALKEFAHENKIKKGQWIVGFGWDDSVLEEKRAPNRHDIDKISTEYPILLVHVSGHVATMNSAALEKLGIDAKTVTPQGGVIERDEKGAPTGVLEETAWMELAAVKLPLPEMEERLKLLQQAIDYYASHGITTAQDGLAVSGGLLELKEAAKRGMLEFDVVAYPAWTEADELMKAQPVGEYRDGLKVAGVKIVLDGSPQAETAWMKKPYYKVKPGYKRDYAGYPAMSDAEANEWVRKFHLKGWPILAHCNGDRASRQFIDAAEQAIGAAKEAGIASEDRHFIMIHAQTVTERQLDRMAKLGIMPSFFATHVYLWGDWHREVTLGPVRASRISPTGSALRRGMRFTTHNDPPVAPPDMMLLIWNPVTRRTRSGFMLGADQRIPVINAIKAVTLDAAYQYFEEDVKGSLKVGKQADLVVLAKNPLKVDPETIKDIGVVKTYARGKLIYDSSATPTGATAATAGKGRNGSVE